MNITVNRDSTTSASLTISFDALDHELAFPCGAHDSELLYQVKHWCGKSASEELAVFSKFAAFVETADPTKTFAGQLDAFVKRLQAAREALASSVSDSTV